MVKVLITGANGFLGANLARMLSKKYEVKILVRKNADLKALEGLDLDIYYGNIDDADHLLKAVRGC
ncbi:MAG TPA: NAD-dependent epimerase/dehydratase family protein, partial [Hanamia sp.]|nr:NAD-dependent epimerase/dehydratase family protein [Hanamia sp.]